MNFKVILIFCIVHLVSGRFNGRPGCLHDEELTRPWPNLHNLNEYWECEELNKDAKCFKCRDNELFSNLKLSCVPITEWINSIPTHRLSTAKESTSECFDHNSNMLTTSEDNLFKIRTTRTTRTTRTSRPTITTTSTSSWITTPIWTTSNWTTPNWTTPNWTTPNYTTWTTPNWTTPNYTTWNTPNNTIWTTPNWTTPNYTTWTTPSWSTPIFTTPNWTTTNWTTPNYTIPTWTTPNWTTPILTTPNWTTPNWTTPNYTTPTWTTPNWTTPNWTTPTLTTPNWTTPTITTPSWTFPTWKIPIAIEAKKRQENISEDLTRVRSTRNRRFEKHHYEHGAHRRIQHQNQNN